MSKKGFTLIELLITISFMVILSLATYLILFTQNRGQRDLENTATKITALLRQANSLAVSQSENSDWGVRFEMDPNGRGRYILFSGTSDPANFREFVTMPTTLRFDTSTFDGDSKEIIFEELTGRADSTAIIPIVLNSDPSYSEIIGVYSSGLINYYDGPSVNIALGKSATQSSVYGSPAIYTADRAVDGNTSGIWADNSISHTKNNNPVPSWWEVDLGQSYPITYVNVWNRTDCCADPGRTKEYYVIVSDTPNPTISTPGVWLNYQPDLAGAPTTIPVNQLGRYVRVIFDAGHADQYLNLAEVEVMSPQSEE
jgi:prepilin-type N-terminal cleavage/methylation domain-containing protein